MRARTSYAYYLLSSMHNLATTRSIYYTTRASIIYYIIRESVYYTTTYATTFSYIAYARVTVTGHAYTSRTRVLLVIIILYLFINTRGDSILLFYTL